MICLWLARQLMRDPTGYGLALIALASELGCSHPPNFSPRKIDEPLPTLRYLSAVGERLGDLHESRASGTGMRFAGVHPV